MTHDEAQIETLAEKIRQMERTAARCGDAYLKQVARDDINALRKRIAVIRAKIETA